MRVSPRALTFYGKRQTGYRSPFACGVGVEEFQQTIPLPVKVRDQQTQVAFRQGAIVVTLQKAKGFWSGWAQPIPEAEPSLYDWTVDGLMCVTRASAWLKAGGSLSTGWAIACSGVGNQLLKD